MPVPVPTPRINNNDDTVRLAAVLVPIGSKVRMGDPILDVETDKATFTVEAPVEGYLLKVSGEIGQMLDVGSLLAWIGATPDEVIGSVRCRRRDERIFERAHAKGAPATEAIRLARCGHRGFDRAIDGGRRGTCVPVFEEVPARSSARHRRGRSLRPRGGWNRSHASSVACSKP